MENKFDLFNATLLEKMTDEADCILKEHIEVEILAAILWGSIIDVIEGKIAYSKDRDLDVLVICDNTEKVRSVSRTDSGMPTMLVKSKNFKFDIFFSDISYIDHALSNGRWTVVRAIESGPIVRPGEIIQMLRERIPYLLPFVNNSWNDWKNQAINLLSKASHLIDNGNYAFAEILMRDAINIFCYSLIFKAEGTPVTPSTFANSFDKHFGGSDFYDFFMKFHRLDGVLPADVKIHLLTLSELFANRN